MKKQLSILMIICMLLSLNIGSSTYSYAATRIDAPTGIKPSNNQSFSLTKNFVVSWNKVKNATSYNLTLVDVESKQKLMDRTIATNTCTVGSYLKEGKKYEINVRALSKTSKSTITKSYFSVIQSEAANGITISGTVRNISGKFIENASVQFIGKNGSAKKTNTDINGKFTFKNITEEYGKLVCMHDDYKPIIHEEFTQSKKLSSEYVIFDKESPVPTQQVTNNQTVTSNATSSTPPVGTDYTKKIYFSGIVTDQQTGKVITNANLTFIDNAVGFLLTAQTDSNGVYNIELAKDFTYAITVNANGYEKNEESITATGSLKKNFVLKSSSSTSSYGKYIQTPFLIYDGKSNDTTKSETVNLFSNGWSKLTPFKIGGKEIISSEATGISIAGNKNYYSSYAAASARFDNRNFDYKKLSWLLEYDDKNIGNSSVAISIKNTSGTYKILNKSEYTEEKLENGFRKISVDISDYTFIMIFLTPNYNAGGIKGISVNSTGIVSVDHSYGAATVESQVIFMGPYVE